MPRVIVSLVLHALPDQQADFGGRLAKVGIYNSQLKPAGPLSAPKQSFRKMPLSLPIVG